MSPEALKKLLCKMVDKMHSAKSLHDEDTEWIIAGKLRGTNVEFCFTDDTTLLERRKAVMARYRFGTR